MGRSNSNCVIGPVLSQWQDRCFDLGGPKLLGRTTEDVFFAIATLHPVIRIGRSTDRFRLGQNRVRDQEAGKAVCRKSFSGNYLDR
jgi:hypothetical protein